MVDVNTFLLMIVYSLCAVLLVCLIVFVIKLVSTVNRVNGILDEVDNKMAILDKAFHVVDVVTDNMAMISDRLVDSMTNFIRKLLSRKKVRKEEEISNE